MPIGTVEVIQSAPRERFVAFWDKWYRPDNITAIVVGDVDDAFLGVELLNQVEDVAVLGPDAVEEHPGFAFERTTQVIVLGTDQIVALDDDDFTALSTAQIASLTTQQLAAMGTEQAAAIETAARAFSDWENKVAAGEPTNWDRFRGPNGAAARVANGPARTRVTSPFLVLTTSVYDLIPAASIWPCSCFALSTSASAIT